MSKTKTEYQFFTTNADGTETPMRDTSGEVFTIDWPPYAAKVQARMMARDANRPAIARTVSGRREWTAQPNGTVTQTR